MFRNGSFVATYLEDISDNQIQPSGVDITVAAMFKQEDEGLIARSGKRIGDRKKLTPDEELFELSPGSYIVQYGEIISVPIDHVGFVFPRSSLIRNSCELHTAVWDPGYTGRGEGLLVANRPITIEVGARIAQFVLATADSSTAYDGSYQGENL